MDNKFVDGLMVKAPRQGAPDFVKGSISIKTQALITWLTERQNQEWINLDILVSEKKGTWYAKVNDYKKEDPLAPAREALAPQYDDQGPPFDGVPFN